MIQQQFTQPLLDWFDLHGRKDLPWQHPRSPYFVWLSEIMLQQTQVKTVIPYFNRFVERFPSIDALALASVDDVLTLWAGLGYYSRARNLHRCAKQIMESYQGIFPSSIQALVTLPGIGESTAAAIASLAFNQPTAILDGNVKRVLCRFFAITEPPDQTATKKKLWQLAQTCMEQHRCVEYTQAIMDLGATCCTRLKPDCRLCPLAQHCQAYAKGMVEQLPVRVAKKSKPTREGHFMILHTNDNAIFVRKNKDAGIWGGLWCLPNFSDLNESLLWLEKTWSVKQSSGQPSMELKHTFTHFHLRLKVYTYLINDRERGDISGRWLAVSEKHNVGLPKPISMILNQFWQL